MLPTTRLRARRDDGDADAAEQRRPEPAAGHSAVSRVGRVRRSVVVGRRRSVASCRRCCRRAATTCRTRAASVRAEPAGVDLALDGGAADADLHVVVDLQPDPILLEPGDEAVDAGGGHHLVADLQLGLHRLLLTHPPPLRADHQEVHRQRDQQQDAERDDAAAAAADVSQAAEDGRRSSSSSFRSPGGAWAGGEPTQPVLPDGQHLAAQAARTCRRRSPPAGAPSAPASRPRCAAVSKRDAVGSPVANRWRR